jgi:hypothetical protein
MSGWAFEGVTAETIKIDKANPVFRFCAPFIVNLEENSTLRYLGTEKDVLIGNQFSGIAAGCFRGLKAISTIHFQAGSHISFFGNAAFAHCYGLEWFFIPATVVTIADECFRRCDGFRKVTFENGSRVSVLGERAFSECGSLASICIPASVTSIGPYCFDGHG